MSHRHLFPSDHIKNCLSLMFSTGMNDYSGQFAFEYGFPAKSGISGVIGFVIPGVLGGCVFSPRVDNYGNSTKGLAFLNRFSSAFNFHSFDGIAEAYSVGNKVDPREYWGTQVADISKLLYSASRGDIESVRRKEEKCFTCTDFIFLDQGDNGT